MNSAQRKMRAKWFIALLSGVIAINLPLSCEGALPLAIKPNILGPPLPHKPFVVAWNVASDKCEGKFGVPLDLSDFDIVYNQDKGWQGDAMVIFNSDQMGYYPSIGDDGEVINGGIPQLGNLDSHLTKAREDIINFIPDPDFQGLAVIDWESWLPQWNKMSWGTFLAYQNMSLEKVKHDHPDWPHDKVLAKAKSEYETSAWGFISFTLSLARIVRPKALWGFYLYPDCYNYNKTGDKFSLKCTNQTVHLNDEIHWVFDKSTALYPSAYLGDWFRNNRNAVYFVANRIIEAIRVDNNRIENSSIPIFAYHSITYRNEYKFLNLYDLRNSIGVATVLGASGMVVWGDYNLANSVEECKNLSNYVSNILGPYVKMASDFAFKCSLGHCSGNGRCVFTNFPTGNHHGKNSHLNAASAWNIIKRYQMRPNQIFDGLISGEKVAGLSYAIVCQCYNGWSGDSCANPYYSK